MDIPFVPPAQYFPALQTGHQFIQYQMLPIKAALLGRYLVQTLGPGHKAGIKAVDQGGGGDLVGAAPMVGPDDMDQVGGFQDAQVFHDGGAADAAGTGE
jgi:hypothetical protein